MFELSFLFLIAIAAVVLACQRPVPLIVFLIAAGPYYSYSKALLGADSMLFAWKDVVLAGLLVGIFLRLRGRLESPMALTLLLAYSFISACIPGDWQIGALGFRATCQWMLLALATCSLREPSLLPALRQALIWSGTGAGAVYIVEHLFYHNQDQIAASMGIRGEDRWRYAEVLDRFSLIFGNPNSLAVFLVICACFAFAWYLSGTSGRTRFVAMLCGGICVAGVLVTASRGALAALLMSILVVGRQSNKNFRRIALGVALGFVMLALQPELLTQRLEQTGSDSFLSSYRYQVWTETLERAISSPQLFFVGSGLGTYGGYVSDANGISDVITENQFFKILGEQGTLGLLLMFGLIWRLKKPGYQTDKADKSAVAVSAALTAVLTYCLVGNILDGLIVAVPFWTLAGVRLGGSLQGGGLLAAVRSSPKPPVLARAAAAH